VPSPLTTGLVLDFDASILAGYADGTAIGVPLGVDAVEFVCWFLVWDAGDGGEPAD